MQMATVYRRLLKAVYKHVGKDGGKGHFRDFVSQEFRKNSALSDQEAARQKVKLASDYTYLINSVHHHQDLLFSYNIAVDRSDEMTKILNKSAASVGLRLPDAYQP
ncbi:Complex 1 protein (LYR family) [Carex littledalei]|uniref:Complex 1 protein (LYR family) n=1 Tax=Carex littledalei TaxID=544730 RepID=A0A833VKU4_9POAL|nr:Complex 1 protein (LYR family) [Carex littledalei]